MTPPPVADIDQRISDQLVRLVQIIFGLVLAQSLLLYREVVVHPFSQRHWLATLALGTMYLTVILSWVDWHTAMELRPYGFDIHDRRRRFVEQVRLLCDVAVVTIYAYTLFTIAAFVTTPCVTIWRFLLGFPLVFSAYLLSGVTRIAAYRDRAASRWVLLVVGLFASTGVLITYLGVFDDGASRTTRELVNACAVAATFAVMMSYRLLRSWTRRSTRPQPHPQPAP